MLTNRYAFSQIEYFIMCLECGGGVESAVTNTATECKDISLRTWAVSASNVTQT